MLLLSISCYKDEVVSVTNSRFDNYSVSYLNLCTLITQNVNTLPINSSFKILKPYYMDTLFAFAKVCNTEGSSK